MLTHHFHQDKPAASSYEGEKQILQGKVQIPAPQSSTRPAQKNLTKMLKKRVQERCKSGQGLFIVQGMLSSLIRVLPHIYEENPVYSSGLFNILDAVLTVKKLFHQLIKEISI